MSLDRSLWSLCGEEQEGQCGCSVVMGEEGGGFTRGQRSSRGKEYIGL